MNFSGIIDRRELLNILLIKTPVKMADIVYFYYLDNITRMHVAPFEAWMHYI